MRVLALIFAVLAALPTGARAVSSEFLTDLIDRCVSGVSGNDFASMTDGSRFLKLTPYGTHLAFDDPSGTVEVMMRRDDRTYRVSCGFWLLGADALDGSMSAYFSNEMTKRNFVQVKPFVQSGQTYLRCEDGLIEASFRVYKKREQAIFNFVSRTAEPDECKEG